MAGHGSKLHGMLHDDGAGFYIYIQQYMANHVSTASLLVRKQAGRTVYICLPGTQSSSFFVLVLLLIDYSQV